MHISQASNNTNTNKKQNSNNPYIQYINAFSFQNSFIKQDCKARLQSLKPLNDGIIFYQLFKIINNSEILEGQIQTNPQVFIQKFLNLKTVLKSINQYWKSILCRQTSHEQIDLVEIAHHSNQKQIQSFLNLLIKTAILSQNNQIFIEKMLQTSSQSQQYFMKIVQQTMQQKNSNKNYTSRSPGKQKQLYLYDKIMELQHQNQKLILVITDLCEQKQQSQQKYKKLLQKLKQKEKDIQKLNEIISEYTCTPQKRRLQDYLPDTTQKNLAIIDQLNKKIDQLQVHQQELIHTFDVQRSVAKEKLQKLKQLESNQIFFQMTQKQNEEYFNKIQELVNNQQKHKNIVLQLQFKLNQSNQTCSKIKKQFLQLELKNSELNMEVQLKNIKIEELTTLLYNKSSESSPIKSKDMNKSEKNSLSNSLFGQCQELYNQKQNFILLQSNKNLRVQIQRTSRKLLSFEAEMQKKTKQLQKMKVHQIQNKKLVDIISHMTSYRGQENQILLKCIYQLKMKQISTSYKQKKAVIKSNSIQNQSILLQSASKRQNQKQFQTPIISMKNQQKSRKIVRVLTQSNFN